MSIFILHTKYHLSNSAIAHFFQLPENLTQGTTNLAALLLELGGWNESFLKSGTQEVCSSWGAKAKGKGQKPPIPIFFTSDFGHFISEIEEKAKNK